MAVSVFVVHEALQLHMLHEAKRDSSSWIVIGVITLPFKELGNINVMCHSNDVNSQHVLVS